MKNAIILNYKRKKINLNNRNGKRRRSDAAAISRMQ